MFRKKLFYVNAQNHTVCRIKSKSTSSVNNFEDCFLPLYNWKVLEFCKKAFHYFPEKLSHFNVSIAIHLMETKTSSNNSLITFIFRWRVSHVIYFLLKQRVCLLFNRKVENWKSSYSDQSKSYLPRVKRKKPQNVRDIRVGFEIVSRKQNTQKT